MAELPNTTQKKRMSAADKRKRALLVHKVVRFAVQLVFFALSPALFSGAFNGVKYIFAQLGLGAPLEMTSFLALLVALLGFTIVFGRFFCGYACAFGTLGDILFAAFDFLRSKAHLPEVRFPPLLVRVLSLVKYLVLAAICLACFLGVWATYSGNSPWSAFSAIYSGSFGGIDLIGGVLLGLIVIGMIVRERFFCQFLCPLGAVFSLMPVLGFSEYTRKREHCARTCGQCHKTCPVSIWPDADTLEHGECIACGRCAEQCPLGNINLIAVEKPESEGAKSAAESEAGAPSKSKGSTHPVRKTRESWYLVRGSGIGYTLLKAVILLVICWAMGFVRYVPAFSELFGQLPLPF